MIKTLSPGAVADRPVRFGTKAETLQRLRAVLHGAAVLPLAYFSIGSWRKDPEAVLFAVRQIGAPDHPMIVRSSTLHEDDPATLMPGAYLSLPDVRGQDELRSAIDAVIDSYRRVHPDDDLTGHQVLVQPMLDRPALSGVAFTCDPNTGAAYYVLNYEQRGDCSAVTSGKAAPLRTTYAWKHGTGAGLEPRLRRVLALAGELETLLETANLDFEFAFDESGGLYLFQVRPLVVGELDDHSREQAALSAIKAKVASGSRRHPYLLGARTVFGVMPDWNPAEIIGTRPKPLALSLYRRLITDAQWAEQRARYGYRDVRGFPLILDFCGLPYVDVRASCNSLIPAGVEVGIAEKLATHYIDRLTRHPTLYDKIEFDRVFSCYSFTLPQRLAHQTASVLDDDERHQLTSALRALTNELVSPTHPARKEDEASITSLRERFETIRQSDLDEVAQIYWLVEDCRRFGTLAFAGFARLGFVATEMLRSMITTGVLTETDVAQLMSGLDTSTNRMLRDQATMAKRQFLDTYGFLRPGTYDICSPRYDEAPDQYFDWSAGGDLVQTPRPFRPSAVQARLIQRMLNAHGLALDIDALFAFIANSIEQRENAKFEFSRHLSEVLRLITRLGRRFGLGVEELSYLTVEIVDDLYRGVDDSGMLLRRGIDEGRHRYALTRRIVLPPMVTGPDEVEAFHVPDSEPNYITQRAASGVVMRDAAMAEDLTGQILLLPSGDPGYDWIFSRGVAGFVTQYGGANSHMAIRAHQFGVPAVIGAGERLYNQLARASRIHIDCLNHRVEVLR
ncbi:PEP-utilizing enzyme [Plantactinospora sp. KLBMP9567]|uniref:PEP-utilizing enzyme n=1 Tax=Plantactinospora sp. KLBMP9567 TaxID=3085900 RepID=UPI0029822526|nr:PEP-utilizing enzyme [Plantactinospora sp. KLBMP9567]MDW5326755.1 PEP/pyruvate-binding domain-containing protein [Plantactinospora sp. KLBMP9567]